MRVRNRARLVGLSIVLAYAWGCGDDDEVGRDSGADSTVGDASMDATPRPDGALDAAMPDAADAADGFVVRVDEGVPDAGPTASCGVAYVARFVAPDNQQGFAAAVDSTGAVVVTGRNQGVVDFGDGPRDAMGTHGLFVVKIGHDGRTVWSRQYRDSGNDTEPYGIAIGPDDSVLVSGYVNGDIDLGAGPMPPRERGGREIFVLSLASDGATRWAKRYGSGNAWSVTTGASGTVVVAGDASGDIDFGGEIVRSNGQSDVFVLTLDGADGSFVSQHVYGGPRLDAAYAVTVDPSGAIAIAGQTYGGIDFGLGAQGAVDTNHGFIARHAASGAVVYALVSETTLEGHALAALDDGSVIVQSGGGTARIGPDGSELWSRGMPGPPLTRRIALDEDGGVWIAGGGGPLDPACGVEPSARAYPTATRLSVEDGAQLESRGVLFGELGEIAAWSVGVGPSSVVIAGWISGDGHDFGTGPLMPLSDNDVFAVAYGR